MKKIKLFVDLPRELRVMAVEIVPKTKYSKDTKITFYVGDIVKYLQNNKIAYVDKFGREWEKKAIDEIFEALTQKKKIDNVLDYYAFEQG